MRLADVHGKAIVSAAGKVPIFVLLTLSALAADNLAAVYVYRLRVFQGSARRMTLSLDGEQFAYLQNGRFWAIKLPSGEHVLTDKDPDDRIEFSVRPGETLYIRSEWLTKGLLGFNARFSLVGNETAAGDVRRLKPGDLRQIRNKFDRNSRPAWQVISNAGEEAVRN